MAKTKGKADDSGKPKNLTKVTKAKTSEVNARMVIEALNRMNRELKANDQPGHSLAKIRNYISNNHGLEMNKDRQNILKDVMKKEFHQNNIEMTNNAAGGDIKFNMRFQAVIEDNAIPNDESLDSDSEAEE